MAVARRAIITLLLFCGLMHIAAAKVYQVGGHHGWTFQSKNSEFYDNQFKNLTLIAGVDYLNFTFTEGVHNVIAVHQSYLAKCDSSDPTAFNISVSPVVVSALRPSTWGFICGIDDHCSKFGMHVNVTFVSRDSSSPSPSDSTFNPSEANADVSHSMEQSGLLVSDMDRLVYTR